MKQNSNKYTDKMDQKIRELTDKIFNEGVEKGREEADKILAEAQKKSMEMLEDARREAEAIRKNAEKGRDELKSNTTSELKLYTGQTIQALRTSIADTITDKVVSEAVSKSVSDPSFLQGLIAKIVSNWTPGEEIVIETADAKALEAYFAKEAKDLLDKGLVIKEAAGRATEFTIKPQNGSYKIDFGESELVELFKSFLRPRLVEMLF